MNTNVPEFFLRLSLPEGILLLLIAVPGLILFLSGRVFRKLAPLRFFMTAVSAVLIFVALNALLRNPVIDGWQTNPPDGGERPAFARALSFFYGTGFGTAVGSISLLICRISALPVAAFLLLYLLKRRKNTPRSQYRKRCSRCHAVVPLRAQARQNCPYCGTYWNYEDDRTAL